MEVRFLAQSAVYQSHSKNMLFGLVKVELRSRPPFFLPNQTYLYLLIFCRYYHVSTGLAPTNIGPASRYIFQDGERYRNLQKTDGVMICLSVATYCNLRPE